LPPNLRRALLGAGAPILALVVLALTGALTLFTHFARQQDEAYVASSRQLVANTLGERQRAIGDLALDFASWNDAYQLISVRWNQGWIESNYYSGVADGLIVFRRDGAVRYAWISDGLDDEDGRLAHSVAHTAASLPRLDALSGAATSADTVASRIVRLNGRFALMSVAPIAPESDAERMARLAHAEVDYLATIDMLDDDQVEAIGSQLDLAEFAIATTADESGRYVSLALPGADGVSVGVARWLDRRPGSANLSTQLGVVIAGIVLIGGLSLYVAALLTHREVAAAARAEGALESSRLKSEFIVTMSHELRTPLNAIIGYSELLADDAEDAGDDAVRKDARKIALAGRQLLGLINEVLDLSKIEAGKVSLDIGGYDPAALARQAIETVRKAAEANGDTLHLEADSVGWASSDSVKIGQCLLSLLSNAVKFTRNGAITLRVTRHDDQLHFAVSDTGIGMAPETLRRLFQPFMQADSSATRAFGGAGLGLAIAQRLAIMLGGDIAVASTPGAGSAFTLRVPATLREPSPSNVTPFWRTRAA
jgi:signal transduction histidine kinase